MYSKFYLHNCTFLRNNATKLSGSITLRFDSIMYMYNCYFKGNIGKNGASITAVTSKIEIYDSIFEEEECN
jgi:hypothetical protein